MPPFWGDQSEIAVGRAPKRNFVNSAWRICLTDMIGVDHVFGATPDFDVLGHLVLNRLRIFVSLRVDGRTYHDFRNEKRRVRPPESSARRPWSRDLSRSLDGESGHQVGAVPDYSAEPDRVLGLHRWRTEVSFPLSKSLGRATSAYAFCVACVLLW